MDEERLESETPEIEETPGYVERPWWQVWLARLALVIFILILIVYYINFFRGGV